MKILRHGINESYYVVECWKCKCLYAYKQEELTWACSITRKVTHCPECGSHNPHSQARAYTQLND